MSVSDISNSVSSIRDNYLNLLITQLQHQDPTNPMDNSQMTTQLAQLSELEQLEGMNSTFEKVLASTQLGQATSMIGKRVTFAAQDSDAPVTAVVDSVKVIGGKIMLQAGDYYVDPDAVLTISTAATQP